MSEQLFTLHPFPVGDVSADFQMSGHIVREASRLKIEYVVIGDRSDIIIASAAEHPTRQHDLWQHTCFEFFLGLTDSDRYWEFNLSPAGHWNVYRFEGYRQGMQEELAFTSLPFRVENLDAFSLSLELDLQPFLDEYTALINSASPLNPPIRGDFNSSPPLYWGARGAKTNTHQPFDVGITTVIEHQNYQLTYWALTHTGSEADFHRRDSFTIKV